MDAPSFRRPNARRERMEPIGLMGPMGRLVVAQKLRRSRWIAGHGRVTNRPRVYIDTSLRSLSSAGRSGCFQFCNVGGAFFGKRDPDRMSVRIDSQRVRALWRLDIAQRFSAIDGLLQN